MRHRWLFQLSKLLRFPKYNPLEEEFLQVHLLVDHQVGVLHQLGDLLKLKLSLNNQLLLKYLSKLLDVDLLSHVEHLLVHPLGVLQQDHQPAVHQPSFKKNSQHSSLKLLLEGHHPLVHRQEVHPQGRQLVAHLQHRL